MNDEFKEANNYIGLIKLNKYAINSNYKIVSFIVILSQRHHNDLLAARSSHRHTCSPIPQENTVHSQNPTIHHFSRIIQIDWWLNIGETREHHLTKSKYSTKCGTDCEIQQVQYDTLTWIFHVTRPLSILNGVGENHFVEVSLGCLQRPMIYAWQFVAFIFYMQIDKQIYQSLWELEAGITE